MALSNKNPEWLDLLKGESPLLPSSEIEFLADVQSRIINLAMSSKTHSVYDDKTLKEELSVISIVKSNFKQAVDYLRKSTESRQKFLELYPEWCTVRLASELQLMWIANTMEIERKNYIASKTVGNVASLIGGAIALATGGGFIRLLGTALIALGSVTAVRSSQVEESSLHRGIKKAERIIKKDQEYSEKLLSWLSDGSYAQEALSNITIPFCKGKEDWKTLLSHFQFLTEKGHKKELDMFLECMVNNLPLNSVKKCAECLTILMATAMLWKNFFHLFEAFQLVKESCVVQNVAHSVFGISSVVSASKCKPLTSVQKISVGIGMALNVISLLSSAEEMKSDSKEALQIIKAADKLKEEAKMFNDLHDELVKNNH